MRNVVLLFFGLLFISLKIQAAEALSLSPRATAQGTDTSEECLDSKDSNKQAAIDGLSAEIKQLEETLAVKKKELAVVQEIQIKDCDNIEVYTEEDRQILDELKKFCKQDPNSFWAQLDVEGNIKFLLKFSQKNNQVFTFSTDNDVTFKYKGHSLTLKGSYDIDVAGKSGDEGFARNQNVQGSAEYGIDIGKSNFESFAKIAHETSLTTNNDGDNNIHTTTGTLGMKYHIIENDRTDIWGSIGAGVTHKAFDGSLATQENQLVPVLSANLSISHVLIRDQYDQDRLKVKAGAGLLQDLTGPRNTAVTWNAGFDANIFGGFTLGAAYEGSWDQTREMAGNAAMNHTILGTVGFSLDPSAWRSKEAKEKEARAKERLRLWREGHE